MNIYIFIWLAINRLLYLYIFCRKHNLSKKMEILKGIQRRFFLKDMTPLSNKDVGVNDKMNTTKKKSKDVERVIDTLWKKEGAVRKLND